MASTIIDRAFEDNAALRVYLSERNELSLLRTVDESFRKTLVLSVASLFEHQITDALHTYCVDRFGHWPQGSSPSKMKPQAGRLQNIS